MELTSDYFLMLSAALFIIGMMGVLIRRNILIIFMCVELMITAANLSLVAFGWELDSMRGQTFVVFTITVAAVIMSSTHMKMMRMFRRIRTPIIPMMKRAALSIRK